MLVVINKDSLTRHVCAVNCTVDGFSCCSHSTSHRSIDRYLSESRFVPSPPALDAPLEGSRRSIAMRYRGQKLEHRMTHRPRFCIALRGNKIALQLKPWDAREQFHQISTVCHCQLPSVNLLLKFTCSDLLT